MILSLLGISDNDEEFKTLMLGLGLGYLLTIFVTYTFQYVKLYRTKSVTGITPYFLILGNIASVTSLMNSLIFYFSTIHDCFDIILIDCVNRMLGLYQIASQYLCFMIFYFMFVYYYRQQTSPYNQHSQPFASTQTTSLMSQQQQQQTYHSIAGGHRSSNKRGSIPYQWLAVCLFNIVLMVVTVALLSQDDWMGYQQLISYSRALGIIGTVTVVLQYAPQIHSLYQTKHASNLSATTYVLLCCGNLVSFMYLVITTATDMAAADVTTWLPYLVCFLMQLVMVVQIIYYTRRTQQQYSAAGIQYDRENSSDSSSTV